MAWIYLVASEDSQLPFLPTSNQSPIVKSSDTLPQFYFQECQKVNYQSLQSGMMSQPLEEKTCQKSTSFMEVSHARTLVVQDLERAWMESEPYFTWKQLGLFENVSLSSYSSKMCQESEDMCLQSGASLRRLATIAGMDSLVRQKSELLTLEIDGGYLPTLTAQSMGSNTTMRKKGQTFMSRVKNFPILLTTDAKESGSQKMHKARCISRNSPKISNILIAEIPNGGALNPMWAEWFMGYKIGWTELKDSVMQWFRCKQGKPLKS